MTMKTGVRWLISALFLSIFSHPVYAQRHEIFSNRIATLQVVAGSDWLSPPIIPLRGNVPIHISFDELSHTYQRYVYKIEHCEADWSVSQELFESDYLEGFASGNPIDDVVESINTNVLYTHYSIRIPNEYCQLKMSGNYRLTVYDDNNDDEPVLTACFMVVEPLMGVALGMTTNTDIDINHAHQQVSMDVNYSGINVNNPQQQIKTVVMQNGRWDNARINTLPQYTMPDGLRWEHNRHLIFEAGNEYRKFEVLDVDHPTMGVDQIEWDGRDYLVHLFPDTPRPNYLYDEDANGAFYIRNSDNIENDRMTDYVLVNFLIPNVPRMDGEVYINGAWTNDRFLPRYRMQYDEEKCCYHATVQLKQGYYSYQYLLVRPDGSITPMPTEGSYHQTENSYQALVYYKEQGGRTDRLVGYQQIRNNK